MEDKQSRSTRPAWAEAHSEDPASWKFPPGRMLAGQSRILEAFLKHSTAPLAFLDRDFNFVRVNEAYARAGQRDSSEFPGHNHFEFYPHGENEAIFRNALRTRTPYTAVARPFTCPDHPEWGVTYWDWTLTPLLDEGGEVEFLVLFLRDVTECVRKEQRLANQDQKLRALLANAPLLLWSTDLDGTITMAEGTLLRSLRRSPADLIGHSVHEFIANRPDLQEYIRQALAGQDAGGTTEYGGLTLDAHCAPRKGDGGEVIGMIGVALDITDRKRVEDRYRTLAQNLPSIVYRVFLREGSRMEFSNDAFETTTGYHPSELARGTICCIDPLIDSRDRKKVIREVQQAIDESKPFEVEYRITAKDGRQHHFLERGRPIPGSDGHPLYLDGVIFDVTDLNKSREIVLAQRNVAFSLAGGLPLEDACDIILRTAIQTSGMDCGGVYVIDGAEDLRLMAWSGLSRSFAERASLCRHGSDEWQIVMAGKPVYYDFVEFGLNPPESRDGEVLRTTAVVPVMDEGKVIACMNVASHAEVELPAYVRAGLESLAVQIGSVIAHLQDEEQLRAANAALESQTRQLRALASELTQAEQRERRRISSVLHDHLQQLLVVAKFRTESLMRSREDGVRECASELTKLLDQTIETSRSLTCELAPPILHEEGFHPALRWLVRWMKDRYGLRVEVVLDEEAVPQGEELMFMLFQAVRELLFNVVKHARTGSARLQVERQEDCVRIAVSDDGIGFEGSQPAESGTLAGGFGLFSIRERLGLLGGRIEIDTTPGRGSRIVLIAPMGDASAAEPAAPPDGA